MGIRVLRVLEYDYPDIATMERDMKRWFMPIHGVKEVGGGRGTQVYVISSSMLPVALDGEGE